MYRMCEKYDILYSVNIKKLLLLLLLFCIIVKDACEVYQGGVMCKYWKSKDYKTIFEVKFNHSG